MKHDKFLIGIVIGIVLLVMVAVVVVLVRAPGNEEYRPDDTPEGVAHNYFLAIEREEYDKAYGYLSDEVENKPTLDQFIIDLGNTTGDQETSLKIGETRLTEGRAHVDVTLTTYSAGGILDSSRYSRDETALLRQDAAGQWKVMQFPHPYWAWNWNEPKQ